MDRPGTARAGLDQGAQRTEGEGEGEDERERRDLQSRTRSERATACRAELREPDLGAGVGALADRESAEIVAKPLDRGVGETLRCRRRRRLRVDVQQREPGPGLDFQAVALAVQKDLPGALLATRLGQCPRHSHRDRRDSRDLIRWHVRSTPDVFECRGAGHQVRQQSGAGTQTGEVLPLCPPIGDPRAIEVDQHVRGRTGGMKAARLELGRKKADPADRGGRADQRDQDAGRDDHQTRRKAGGWARADGHELDAAIGAFPQPTAPPPPNFFRRRRSEVIRRRRRFSGVMLDHPDLVFGSLQRRFARTRLRLRAEASGLAVLCGVPHPSEARDLEIARTTHHFRHMTGEEHQ